MSPSISCSMSPGTTGMISPIPVTSINKVMKIKLMAALFLLSIPVVQLATKIGAVLNDPFFALNFQTIKNNINPWVGNKIKSDPGRHKKRAQRIELFFVIIKLELPPVTTATAVVRITATTSAAGSFFSFFCYRNRHCSSFNFFVVKAKHCIFTFVA